MGASIRSSARRGASRVPRLALSVAFLAATLAVWAAYLDPANGYELSLYAGTPVVFWLGIATAVGIGLATALYAGPLRLRGLGLFVSGLSIAAVIGIPLIRDFYYYGQADALKHLGYVRAIAGGTSGLYDFIYPGFHSLALVLSRFTGLPFHRTMLLTIFVVAAVFLVFLPLSVHVLFGNRRITGIAAVSGLLLLPINNVSTSLTFHPFSMAVLFSPVLIYFLFRHLKRSGEDAALPMNLSVAGIGLFITGAAVNFFHPQLTFDIIVLLGAVAAIQLVYRTFRPNHPLASTRAVYAQFIFLVVLFYVWNTQHWKFGASIQNNVEAFYALLDGSQQLGSDVTNRAESASQIGADPVMIALKVFLVSLIYAALSAGLVVVHFLRGSRSASSTEDDILVTYFTIGGFVLAPYMFLQFIGTISNHFFRHLGFVMVIATIMGAVAIARIWGRLESGGGRSTREWVRHLAVPAAAVLLVASVIVFYPSPYMYKSSGQVTEQHLSGFESAFASQPADGSVHFAGIGIGPVREEIALTDAPSAPWDGIVQPLPGLSGSVPPDRMGDLVSYYQNHPRPDMRRDHYVAVTQSDFETEVIAQDGLRYTRSDFASLASQPGVYKVRSNGGFTLYYVDTDCDTVCGTG